VSWWGRRSGKASGRKPAGQVSLREYLETGMWRTQKLSNTYANSNHPRFQEAARSHDDALRHVDELLNIMRGQQNLIDLLVSLGEETDDGLWLPK